MIPELGSFAIILALCFALLQGGAVLWGWLLAKNENAAGIYFSLSTTCATGQFFFLAFAMSCLIACFLTNDVSVIYVREHSHQLLPLLYRIGAAWGGHEGSVLLWCLILSGWTLALVIFSLCTQRSFAESLFTTNLFYKILMVLGFVSAGFIAFLLLTSNPFQRDFPTELINGNDLTPILQDPGLIFHPPHVDFLRRRKLR